MRISLKLPIILLLFHQIRAQATRIIPAKDPNNILLTFGSCNSYYGNEPKDIFYRIAETNPDVWIWLGDVAYVDEKVMPPYFRYAGEEKIKEKLHEAKTSPEYVALRKATNIIGTWDDHDYGLNNAGRSFEHKNITQQLWLDFIDEPRDSPRRKRQGVYESYYIGDSSKIKVILLDVRYFKDDTWFQDSIQKDVLGEQQWKWLENELATNTAQYVLIGSGIQVFPDDRILPEHWFPESRKRLLGLIRKYKISGVIFLSGDVHFAEIMKYPCKERVGYELYEFTSSGLTHHVSTHVPLADQFVNVMFPKTYSTEKDRYLKENFGLMRFNFETKTVEVELRDFFGKSVLTKTLHLSSLQFNPEIVDDKLSCITERNKYLRFLENFGNAILAGKWYALVLVSIVLLVMWGIVKSIFKILLRIFFPSSQRADKVKQA